MRDHPIDLRVVDLFEEPLFTELVKQLLHEPGREEVIRRFLSGPGAPATSAAASVQRRIGAFHGDALVGWSHGWLLPGGSFHVASSAVRPDYRRQGLYTRLIAAIEEQARALGCLRVTSHHRADNNAVLIAKLKLGYTIYGTEFTEEMGLLVKLVRHLDAKRDALFRARVGSLEKAVLAFGGQAQ